MATITVLCPSCQCDQVVKFGQNAEGKQRFRCDNESCKRTTFMLDYTYNGHKPGVKEKIINMALNASGIRDTAFGITSYYTDHWVTYYRHIEAEKHFPGKRCTQKIERKHLNLRTRLKRLIRKTICFSKSIFMHDTVIGLFINRYEFKANC